MKFKISSKFKTSKAQEIAISNIIHNIENPNAQKNSNEQVLLGITGSGKTFVMANIIERTGRPAIILAHNKTLVAQLYQEFKAFFPDNAVEYFVSYYDYYQPEAYVAKTDSYIQKDASINDQIDRLRHSATRSLIERDDVIVVASVSAIYGLGDRVSYETSKIELKTGQKIGIRELIFSLVCIQFENRKIDFKRGSFRNIGDIVDIFPSHSEDFAYKISFFGNEIESIWEFDVLTGMKTSKLDEIVIFSNSHHATSNLNMSEIVEKIKIDLEKQIEFFKSEGRLVEAARIKERTENDIESLLTTKTCQGIENYSHYLTSRARGEAPPTLFEYIPKNSLLFVDESHVMVSQIGAMFNGDHARKQNLIHYGFRLPSALDNRPLKFEEWDEMKPFDTIYVSATPAQFELQRACGSSFSFNSGSFCKNLTELLIRPTGLLDPICLIRKTEGQVHDLMSEIQKVKSEGFASIVITLTKKMAEDLHEFFLENGINSEYIHSDVKTLKRIEIINNLRTRKTDVLIGVNLLREGIDIPECALVAIMDADKEGFLRSSTSLIQIIGRAARNSEGRVILYADQMTKSMEFALSENKRRRAVQIKYNQENGIVPSTIVKSLPDNQKIFLFGEASVDSFGENNNFDMKNKDYSDGVYDEKKRKELELDKDFKTSEAAIRFYSKKMHQLAKNLQFEDAKILRDKIRILEKIALIDE
jgi:excinuclease ABC subunit B